MIEEKAKTEEDDELAVLLPDREITIGKEVITVREFRFVEGLKAAVHAKPILKEMERYFLEGDGTEPSLDDLDECFSLHADAFLHLMSLSTGKDLDWFSGLTDMEGRLLQLTFWEVNNRFFMSRLVLGAISKLATRKPEADNSSAPSPGEKS